MLGLYQQNDAIIPTKRYIYGMFGIQTDKVQLKLVYRRVERKHKMLISADWSLKKLVSTSFKQSR
jgi:hypothetical protein